MELAADVRSALRFAGSADLSDAVFVPLVKGTLAVVAGGAAEAEALAPAAKAGADPLTLKSVFDGLQAVVFEAARLNLEPDALRSYLSDELQFVAARADAVSQLFERARPQVRSRLAMVSTTTLPQVVEVDWRLDYHMKSSTLDRANQLSYLVKLKTRSSVPLAAVEHEDDEEDRTRLEADGELQFSCSVEQLQDLVTKLKDAVKQMERSGTIS